MFYSIDHFFRWASNQTCQVYQGFRFNLHFLHVTFEHFWSEQRFFGVGSNLIAMPRPITLDMKNKSILYKALIFSLTIEGKFVLKFLNCFPKLQQQIVVNAIFNFIETIFTDIYVRPGVNFINVFTHSFHERRSQRCKKLLNLTVFLALLGSAWVKAAHEMLVKLTLASQIVGMAATPREKGR